MGTAVVAIDPAGLKAQFKQRCLATGNAYQNWQIRVHRSLSWYKRAVEFDSAELDARFLFLWIALNSLYSRWDPERNEPGRDTRARQEFIRRICAFDAESIRTCIHQHRSLIKNILGDPYLSDVFWRNPDDPKARGRATQEVNYLDAHLRKRAYARVISETVDRLFILRGQLVHGASTRNSKHNRGALRHATLLLERMLPVVLQIVIDHGCGDDWPQLCYPPEP